MKRLAIFLLFFFISSLQAIQDPEMAIIIPSYNNEQWCIENIRSCARQKYPHWRLYYINDASTDQTGKMIQDYIQRNNLQDRCTLINNQKRKGALRNIYELVSQLPPETIVVTVDGDDFLSTSYALNIIAEAYKDGTTWITYGNYIEYPDYSPGHCESFPRKVLKKNKIRRYKWITSHLRTFYAGLFQKIKKEDLQYKGKFYPAAWDLAMMFPMLEMASKGHITFIKKTIYLYNRTNPISDFRARRELQKKLNSIIRKKQVYQPLNTLF